MKVIFRFNNWISSRGKSPKQETLQVFKNKEQIRHAKGPAQISAHSPKLFMTCMVVHFPFLVLLGQIFFAIGVERCLRPTERST